MPLRKASAQWNGPLVEGNGTMAFGSGAYEGQYSYDSRFEEGTGTNPEELIAAAHAGCFSMAFAGNLTRAGHNPEQVNSEAQVQLDKQADGFAITHIHLVTRARVPGIDDATFQRVAEETKVGCPVSQALKAVDLSVEATLES